MTTYRTGTHHGTTIVRSDDGHRCARPDHDCERGHMVAVVTNEDWELAERIALLLNASELDGTPDRTYLRGASEALADVRRQLDAWAKLNPLHDGRPAIATVMGMLRDAAAELGVDGVDQVSASPATETDEIHSGVGQDVPNDLGGCEGRCAFKPDPDCPVHAGRRPKGPKPPPVGPGCVCDGSGRTCPRHGAVI